MEGDGKTGILCFFFSFHCSNHLNVGTSKRTLAENLLLVGSSLSEVIEMIFKIQFINRITCSITTGVSVGISVVQGLFVFTRTLFSILHF